MKRIVSLVLALSMVLSMFTFAFAGTALPDVAGTDYEAAVSALVELGIVNGYEDGTYKPEKTVTRAEMAKFLVVSSGLEGAAEVSKGATNFSDVAADHWAAGYINVASQYGYINGYPEGTFAPDAIVSYAEAVTMAIRVLGYRTVVESKGTWPTNYIAKATELKVLEDVDYGKYTDGAIRGNVALLMWNMLTTPVWDVVGENESNGLNFGTTETGLNMIDKYFDNYVYHGEDEELVVTGIDVLDRDVTVYLNGEDFEVAEDVDFLNLMGRKVSVLYNKEEEKLVMITPSNDDRVVADFRDELSGDKYDLTAISGEKVWGTAGADNKDYTVAVLGTKKVVDYTTRYSLNAAVIVEELKVRNDEVRINGSELTIDEDAIVLIDGKWATNADIEVGDIVTTLVANELFVVSRDVVTGAFEAVTEDQDSKEYRYFVTVDGEEYSVVNAVQSVVEVDEDGEVVASADLADIIDDEADEEFGKYYGENVKLFLNFLGGVERIEFGEVEENDSTGAFYVLTAPNPSWTATDKKGTTTYVELNGESYEVKSGVVAPSTNVSGDVVYVEFDSKDRVKAIYSLPADANAISGDYDMVKAFANEDGILDDYNYISGEHKVTANTVVVKITPVTYEDDGVELVENYEVETLKGAEALEGVEYALVVTDAEDDFNKAAYVFVWEDAKNTEKTYGIVEKYTKSNGIEYLTIDGTKYAIGEIRDAANEGRQNPLVAVDYVGRAVEFIENEDEIDITMSYGPEELAGATQVVDVEEGRVLVLSGDITIDLDRYEDDLEDIKVFLIHVSETEEDGVYELDSFEEIAYADVKVKIDDRVATLPSGLNAETLGTAETIVIIRGFEA